MVNPGGNGGRTGIFLLLGRILKYPNVMRLVITVAIVLGIYGGVSLSTSFIIGQLNLNSSHIYLG